MKLFKCQVCGQSIYFENRICNSCAHVLGYLPKAGVMAALEPAEGDSWVALTKQRPRVRFCANAAVDACNWMIPDDQAEPFCLACRHNRTIPNIDQDQNLTHWRRMEIAKHRLFYSLIAFRLPLKNRLDEPDHGLTFDFLAPDPAAPDTVILTGHDEGIITINLNEADDAKREALRTAMGEPYRTLLGHFRHEVGHYFWDVLVRDAGQLEACREVFGDETLDYAQALQNHYANGAPPDWQNNYISAYATAHAWEDFAETWSHYLHIIDTLETASAFGLRIHPAIANDKVLHADIDFDPYTIESMEAIVNAWLPLSFAMNNISRSMGQPDLYPFILSKPIVDKLSFIHQIIREAKTPLPKPVRAPRRRLLPNLKARPVADVEAAGA